jgi:alkanesulfonate monooxygenase SsuD/methylene tetrahydromethanopterin reductase-like flavin-dependent oxidoreductase (luciferase family)
MGYAAEAEKIQQLFFEGKRDEAARVIPDELADNLSLVGSKARIKDRLQAWEESKVTTLLVATQDKENLAEMAELIL